jgi:site-specific DNA recombinase
VLFWRVPYGYRRSERRLQVFEPEAEVVRWIFRAYTAGGRSIRQICRDLAERGIPSPHGKPVWGHSSMGRLLRNEASVGTVYYNRNETLEGAEPRRGAKHTKTRSRRRPREEWITISVPAIIDQASFEAAQRVSRDNSKWNPRGAEPGAWLLRGLVECGHCGVGTNCHKMRGRNGSFHRYCYCRNHDPLRAGGEQRRCPERNIRADELDAFVFEQLRLALLDPHQLAAGEGAVLAGTVPTDDELLEAQLAGLERRIERTEDERARLVDAYQAAIIDLTELSRRSTKLTQRRAQLVAEQQALREQRAELARHNRLRQRLAGFAQRVTAALDELDFDDRQRLLRLVVEKVAVSGWHVEIHLKIPLPDDSPEHPRPQQPQPAPRPSSDNGLRPLGDHQRAQLPDAPPPRQDRDAARRAAQQPHNRRLTARPERSQTRTGALNAPTATDPDPSGDFT